MIFFILHKKNGETKNVVFQNEIFLSLFTCPFGCSNSLFRFSLSLTTLIILKNKFY